MKIREFVDKLCEDLGVKQKHLTALLDVSSEALTQTKDETFSPNTATKVMRRLNALTYALYPLLNEPVTPMTRLSVIKTLAYEDIHGNLDSVISALKQDKYQKELLQVIAKNAFEKIRERKKSEDKFLNDYAQILSESSNNEVAI